MREKAVLAQIENHIRFLKYPGRINTSGTALSPVALGRKTIKAHPTLDHRSEVPSPLLDAYNRGAVIVMGQNSRARLLDKRENLHSLAGSDKEQSLAQQLIRLTGREYGAS